MFDTTKFRRTGVALAAAAVTALGVGGIALAQNGGQAQKPAAQAAEPAGPDRDNIQSGDQTSPDTAAEASEGNEAPGQEANEAPGQEANEAPGQENESGSERVNDDGPGGHADEPGNPNADHQFQGQE